MERKLVDYLGFERVGTSWNTAWHMPAYQRNAPQHITNLLCLALPIIFLGVDGKYYITPHHMLLGGSDGCEITVID